MEKVFGLKLEQTPWLSDEELCTFLKSENEQFKEKERLSSCYDSGLW